MSVQHVRNAKAHEIAPLLVGKQVSECNVVCEGETLRSVSLVVDGKSIRFACESYSLAASIPAEPKKVKRFQVTGTTPTGAHSSTHGDKYAAESALAKVRDAFVDQTAVNLSVREVDVPEAEAETSDVPF
jgi:hypothetical protein